MVITAFRTILNCQSSKTFAVETVWHQIRQFGCNINSVKPGRLVLNSSVDVKVTPAVFTVDNACCKVEVKLISPALQPSELNDLNKELKVSIDEHSTHNELIVDVPVDLSVHRQHHPLFLDIAIPYHYSVQLLGSENSSATLSKLECEFVDIKLENGQCELNNVKALNATIQGNNTELKISKSFTGNMSAKIDSGDIVADKVQGQEFVLSTNVGDITVDSLYGFNTSMHCNCGDIIIGSCHGNTLTNTVDGNTNIKSVDGNLTTSVGNGDIDIHLTNHTDVNISTNNGNVNITVPENTSSEMYAQTHQFDVDDALIVDVRSRDIKCNTIEGSIGAEVSTVSPPTKSITVKADSVHVGVMDWITAQNLQFNTDFNDLKV